MSDNEEKSPYHVGYARPPKRSQFAKGQSGNPQGRPKGAKNFATSLRKELKARVPITENGTRKTVSKQDAIAKQLVNKGAAGCPKAMPIVLSEIHQLEGQTGNADTDNVFTSETAQEVLKHMLERFQRATKENNDDVTENQRPTIKPTKGEKP